MTACGKRCSAVGAESCDRVNPLHDQRNRLEWCEVVTMDMEAMITRWGRVKNVNSSHSLIWVRLEQLIRGFHTQSKSILTLPTVTHDIIWTSNHSNLECSSRQLFFFNNGFTLNKTADEKAREGKLCGADTMGYLSHLDVKTAVQSGTLSP